MAKIYGMDLGTANTLICHKSEFLSPIVPFCAMATIMLTMVEKCY